MDLEKTMDKGKRALSPAGHLTTAWPKVEPHILRRNGTGPLGNVVGGQVTCKTEMKNLRKLS